MSTLHPTISTRSESDPTASLTMSFTKVALFPSTTWEPSLVALQEVGWPIESGVLMEFSLVLALHVWAVPCKRQPSRRTLS